MRHRLIIRSNALDLSRAWQKRSTELVGIVKRATTEATKELLSESKKQLQSLIYDKPIPTRAQVASEQGKLGNKGQIGVVFGAKSKAGAKNTVAFTTSKKWANKPAWRRTGNLRRSEKMRIVSPTVGQVVNDAKANGKGYAVPRHEMKNTRYPAPWRTIAVERQRKVVRDIYGKALREANRRGLLKR